MPLEDWLIPWARRLLRRSIPGRTVGAVSNHSLSRFYDDRPSLPPVKWNDKYKREECTSTYIAPLLTESSMCLVDS